MGCGGSGSVSESVSESGEWAHGETILRKLQHSCNLKYILLTLLQSARKHESTSQ